VVAYTSLVSLEVLASSRIEYPTRDLLVPRSFLFSPSSSLTRRAREIAEILLGSVQYTLQGFP
jgi:hypothetical protein